MRTCVLWAGRLLSALALFQLASAAWAQASLDALGEEDAEQVARLERQLQTRTSVDFVDMPLHEVAQKLGARLGVNVVLARRELEDAGITRDAPVTCRLSDVKVATVLDTLLRDLKLAWVIQDGIVVITTSDDAESKLHTRLYPVLDLVTVRGASSPDGEIADYDSLIDAITTTIEPDSWDEVGGPGTIIEMPSVGVLIVSQTREIHPRIEGLLASLRRAKALQGIPSATRLPLPSRRTETSATPLPPPRHYSSTPAQSWQLPRVHGAE